MGLWLKQDDGTLVSVGGMGMDDYVITGDPHNPPANWADQQLLYSDEHGLWMKRDGEIIQIAGHDGTDGTDGIDGTNGTNGVDGRGWTAGHYDHENGTVRFESDDDLGFTTGSLRGGDGADGKGWVSGEYLEESGRVQFTSNDGLGFQTLDLRGADGADGEDGGPHDHDEYLPLAGGTVTGDLQVDGQLSFNGVTQMYSQIADTWKGLRTKVDGQVAFDFYSVEHENLIYRNLRIKASGDGAGDLRVDGIIHAPGTADNERDAPANVHINDSGYLYKTKVGSLPLSGGTVTGDLQVDGQTLASRGSATAPGLSFASFKGTGFYPGSTNVATHVNGVWQFVVYEDKTRVIRDLQVDGKITNSGGTEEAPSYTFTGAETSGIYGSVNYVALTVDSKARMVLYKDQAPDSDGREGVR